MPENWNLGMDVYHVLCITDMGGDGPLSVTYECSYVSLLRILIFAPNLSSSNSRLEAASVVRRTLPPPQRLKVGKAQLWITHRSGLAVRRVGFYLKLFWEEGFPTQIRWRCQKKGNQICSNSKLKPENNFPWQAFSGDSCESSAVGGVQQ